MQTARRLALVMLLTFFATGLVQAHCQVPCGIYDDAMRFQMMREHITTLEKAATQINNLSTDPARNANQLVRWVMTKDSTADEFSHIVTWYFMAQRIKPDTTNYHEKLELLHRMQLGAMKAKQTSDLAATKELSSLVDKFEDLYLDQSARAHLEEHPSSHTQP